MIALVLSLFLGCTPGGLSRQPLEEVSWDLVLDPDEASVQSGRVTSVAGFTPYGLAPSLDGREQGGVAPFTFDADSRLHSEASLGTATAVTVEIVHKPADIYGTPDRGYLLYFENNSSWAPDHHVFSQHANLGGTYLRKGVALAGAWSTSPQSVAVYNGLQVETWVVRADGTITLYRNGHDVDHLAWSPSTLTLADMWFGAGYGDPLGAAYRGSVYSLRVVKRALSRAEALSSQEAQINTFGIPSDYAWQPSDEPSLTAWYDEHDIRVEGAGVRYWVDHAAARAFQATSEPQRPAKVRDDGLLAIHCDGSDDGMGATYTSEFFGSATYEYAFEATVHSTNSTNQPHYDLEQVLGDTNGFFWSAFRQTQNGPEFVAGHYNGSFVASVVVPVSLDVEHDFHVWLVSGYLHASVDGAEGTPVATGTISNRSYGLRLCGRNTATAIEATVTKLVTFSSSLDATGRAALNTWLERSDL